jgi:hypothetical protein
MCPNPACSQLHMVFGEDQVQNTSGSWGSPRSCPRLIPIVTARFYLGDIRLLGVNEAALPSGSAAIEVISSPLGETNISKLGPPFSTV